MSRPDWLRANRWWILALPFALALMLAASAYRVNTFWWENGFHDETGRAEPGKPLEVVNHFKDGVGETTRTFSVTFTGLSEVDEIPIKDELPIPTPDGMTAYKVHLDFEADPMQDMNNCVVSLLDTEDNHYRLEMSGPPTGQSNNCVPLDTPGPRQPLFKEEKRGQLEGTQPRPRKWSVEPILLVKEGAKLTEARVAFQWPEYVVLPMPR